jgi:hypothetical protein
MDTEDYTYVVIIGEVNDERRELKTPDIKRNNKAFVKRAVAINYTKVTKCIRIGVVGKDSKFMQLGECKDLEKLMPCEVKDIRLLEYECIVARFEGSQITEELILRVEGEQCDRRAKDLPSR